MPTRDLPDWDVLNAQATVWPVTDLGEAAVRLGSIDRFDRRGDVLFLDSFEDGRPRWSRSGAGTGIAADLSTAYARSGRFSARLVTPSNAGLAVSWSHEEALPQLTPFGLEASFLFDTVIDTLVLGLEVYDGTNRSDFYLRYDAANATIDYQDSSGSWVSFLTATTLYRGNNLFHTLKIVGDPDADEYVRALVNDHEEDLSGIAAQVSASSKGPYLVYFVTVKGNSGDNDQIHLDDVIGTQNEPVASS